MKTNLDADFKTNPIFEREGVDIVIREKSEEMPNGLSFRVRRFNSQNPRVKAAMAAYYKPYARQVELGTLDQAISDEITRKLFVDVCLVSWEGVEIDGKPAECNKENALGLFRHLPDLFDTLWRAANNMDNFKEVVGNS